MKALWLRFVLWLAREPIAEVEAARDAFMEVVTEVCQEANDLKDQVNTLTAYINRIEKEGWEADHIEMEKRRKAREMADEIINGPKFEYDEDNWRNDPVV